MFREPKIAEIIPNEGIVKHNTHTHTQRERERERERERDYLVPVLQRQLILFTSSFVCPLPVKVLWIYQLFKTGKYYSIHLENVSKYTDRK